MSNFSIAFDITGKSFLKPVFNEISKDFSLMQKNLNSSMMRGFDGMAKAGQSAMLKITAPLTLGIGLALKQFGEFENLNVGITTSLANKGATRNEAENFVKDLTTFAKASPFETFDLMREASKMSSMGVAMNDIMPTIKMLGDIAGGTGGDFSRLSLAFLQVKAKGKLMGGEINQFAENMFGVRELLAKELGRTPEQIMEMGEKGLLTFDMLERAMKKTTMQGGVFFNAMNNKMQTFNGKLSTLKDSFSLLGIKIGNAVNNAFGLGEKFMGLSGLIDKLTLSIEKMSPGMVKFTTGLIAFGIIAPPLLFTIGMLGKGFLVMRAGLGFLGTATTTVASRLPMLATGLLGVGRALLVIPKGIMAIAFSLRSPTIFLQTLRLQIAGLGVGIVGLFTNIGTFAKRFLAPFFVLEGLFVAIRGLLNGLFGEANGGFGTILATIGKLLSGVMEVGKFIKNIIDIALTGIEIAFFYIGKGIRAMFGLISKVPGLGGLKPDENKEVGGGIINKMKGANSFLETINQEARLAGGLDTVLPVAQKQANPTITQQTKVIIESPVPIKVKSVDNQMAYNREGFSIAANQKANSYLMA
jgi:tape measure domain-containing protein